MKKTTLDKAPPRQPGDEDDLSVNPDHNLDDSNNLCAGKSAVSLPTATDEEETFIYIFLILNTITSMHLCNDYRGHLTVVALHEHLENLEHRGMRM